MDDSIPVRLDSSHAVSYPALLHADTRMDCPLDASGARQSLPAACRTVDWYAGKDPDLVVCGIGSMAGRGIFVCSQIHIPVWRFERCARPAAYRICDVGNTA